MLKALYGMLVPSLLYYKKFRKDIKAEGYQINPYDPCVANKIIDGEQHTLVWHVDNVKASHINLSVNNKFAEWAEMKYGSPETGHVTVTHGDKYDYLGMILDYLDKGQLKVDLQYCVENMLKEFPEKIKLSKVPWTEKLFNINNTSPKIDSN